MITSASRLRLAAIVAVLASSLLHVGAMAIAPKLTADIRIAGSDTEQSATLGSNFADLVKAGDKLDPAEAEDTATTEPAVAPPIEPVKTNATEPVAPHSYAAVSPPEFKIEPSRIEGLIPPSPVEKLEAIKPELATVQPRIQALEPVEPKPSETTVEPVQTVETVTPVEEPKVVPKPVPKPKQKVAKAKKVEKPKKATSGKKQAKSKVNNKSGAQNGKKTAKAASSGKSKKKSKARNSGNAAASNYPGKVYSKIARTRQRNAGGRGVAQVRFNVSSSGRAVSVSIARSSGNARIDSAAVAHVKRASPFPKPPPGAQTRYVIPIEFRR